MYLSAIAPIDLLLAAAVFGLVLSIWVGIMLLWASRRSARLLRLAQRIGSEDGKHQKGTRVLHLWREGRDVTTAVPDAMARLSLRERLDIEFRRAGWKMNALSAAAIALSVAVMLFLATLVVFKNPILALGMAVVVIVVARILLARAITKREAQFERQFVDALELAARSLRAGHPLVGAFQLVSEEMQAPVKNVFSDICQRHALGSDLEGAIREVSTQSPSADLKLFATSVAIQIRSGGNLATLMERLAAVIRDRIRLSRRVRVLTAQTQMSKRILLVLPFFVFALFSVLNPTYMEPFYTTTAGRIMLGGGVIGLALGSWMMNRMTQLKY
jgi:tight adherence protein B